MVLGSGQVLASRYVLARKLGEGRTSMAWLARDQRSGADCVVKILRDDLARVPAERGRFLATARLQQTIVHPNVLACTDAHDGDPTFAVFDGKATADLTRMRGAEPWKVVRALSEVAGAVAAVHARGYVHRDLKASNVLLSDDGRALLSDFGLAAAAGDAGAAAGGSPFTASPEQLAGVPPSIADDVYAFGALAFELITGYPPFYPDAAMARAATAPAVLASMRARMPAELERLVTRCLARQGAERPRDMTEVIDALRGVSATAMSEPESVPRAAVALRAPDDDADAIAPQWRRAAAEVPDAAQLRSQGFRRGLLVGSLVFLIVIAGLTFFVLPDWVARNEVMSTVVAPAPPPPPPAAADSVPEQDPQAEAKRAAEEKRAAERHVAEQLRAALAAGAAAIAAGNSLEASRQYAIAAGLDPANAAAQRGLKRAAVLDEVRTLLAQAAEYERTGALADAERSWRKALELDPDTTAARDALARLKTQQSANAYSAAVAEGLAALSRGNYAAARAAYERAGRIRPGAPEVQDGLEQVERALAGRTIEQHLEAARRAEGEERWRDAQAEYRAALAADANLLDAQKGIARVEPRVMLDAALSAYIERPERLYSSEIRGAARTTLSQAAAIGDSGPVLARQVAQLRALLAAAEKPVRLSIASDNLTEVTIYRVGRLGAFDSKDVELLPGRYTAVGTRPGFRDVRREFTIVPGKEPPPVVIRCEEKI